MTADGDDLQSFVDMETGQVLGEVTVEDGDVVLLGVGIEDPLHILKGVPMEEGE